MVYKDDSTKQPGPPDNAIAIVATTFGQKDLDGDQNKEQRTKIRSGSFAALKALSMGFLSRLSSPLPPPLMAPQFTSIPTKHVVRPLLAAPCPVTLPVLLTNIIPERFPLPLMFTDMDIDTSRNPTPPPGPHRAPTPPPQRCAPPPPRRRSTPDSRESSLTPVESEDENSDSFMEDEPTGSRKIARPSGANIQAVKSLFKDRYLHLTKEEQDKKYTDFRTRLDGLCTQYLRPSVALTYQNKDDRYKVNNKMNETFPWLAHYDNYWPVSVCLQSKLHNSAARAVDKSTRKAANILAGVAPPRKLKRAKSKAKSKQL